MKKGEREIVAAVAAFMSLTAIITQLVTLVRHKGVSAAPLGTVFIVIYIFSSALWLTYGVMLYVDDPDGTTGLTHIVASCLFEIVLLIILGVILYRHFHDNVVIHWI